MEWLPPQLLRSCARVPLATRSACSAPSHAVLRSYSDIIPISFRTALSSSTFPHIHTTVTRTIGIARCWRPADDPSEEDASFSPEEDELFGVEGHSDYSTEPTDIENDDGDDDDNGEDDDKLFGGLRTHRSTTAGG